MKWTNALKKILTTSWNATYIQLETELETIPSLISDRVTASVYVLTSLEYQSRLAV